MSREYDLEMAVVPASTSALLQDYDIETSSNETSPPLSPAATQFHNSAADTTGTPRYLAILTAPLRLSARLLTRIAEAVDLRQPSDPRLHRHHRSTSSVSGAALPAPALTSYLRSVAHRSHLRLVKLTHGRGLLALIACVIIIIFLAAFPFPPRLVSSYSFPLLQQEETLQQQPQGAMPYVYSDTLGIRKLAERGDAYDFDWADWKNLTDQFWDADLPQKSSEPQENNSDPQTPPAPPPETKFSKTHGKLIPFKMPEFDEAGSVTDLRWLAHMYLAWHAPPPAKIIFLGEPAEFQISDDQLLVEAISAEDKREMSVVRKKRDVADRDAIVEKSKSFVEGNPPVSAGKSRHVQWLPGGTSDSTVQLPQVFIVHPKEACMSSGSDEPEIEQTPPPPQGSLEKAKEKLHSLLHLSPESGPEPRPPLSDDCDPTQAELIRRVYTSVEINNELPPIYPVLNAVDETTFEGALGAAAASVYINDTDTNHTMHFRPEEHANEHASTLEEQYHARLVHDTLGNIAHVRKFFGEAIVLRKNNTTPMDHHMDWRFYSHQLYGGESFEVLHRVFRAWSQFAQEQGILFWLAHGTLMGWHWNGLSMPFDLDIDIQMPIAELDRLARKFNNTFVVESPERGPGRYLIEVAPGYVERVGGNLNNLIDARFVDTLTGAYIDITGVAHQKRDPPSKLLAVITGRPRNDGSYGCKNKHYYHVEDIFPLRRTLFQGAVAYVPHHYEQILDEEYRKWRVPKFEGFVFDGDLRLWVPELACASKLQNEGARAWTDESLDGLERYCGDATIGEQYRGSRHLTAMHAAEMALEQRLREQEVGEEERRRRMAYFAIRQRGVYE